jgi:hypothetical protein
VVSSAVTSSHPTSFRTWTDPPPKDYKDFTKPKTEFESEANPTGREKETFR